MMRLALKQLDSKLVLEGSYIETGERFITWNEIDMPWLDERRRSLIKPGQRPDGTLGRGAPLPYSQR
ncbi:hypothetical protein [Ktedonobacter sp. SOSP1-52]|uniref:hypothetical protein n=1 Tax=Ktedonobacter sp. SOSP1-52 TaxID=2778366 RepID=UPI0019150CAA|nr:hypothetical protein [Ktedonobacter sp. SOSP1-52]